jgi:hypothetical protein
VTPWDRLTLVRDKLAAAKARVQGAEQRLLFTDWTGVPEGKARAARELESARSEERWRAGFVADAEAVVERLRLEAEERSRVIAPDRYDHDLLHVLDRLERKIAPEFWEKGLREGDEAERRAVKHLGWLRDLRRRGGTVEGWRRGGT